MPTLAGNKQWTETISSFTDRVFYIFWRKMYGSDQLKVDIKVVNPAPTQ